MLCYGFVTVGMGYGISVDTVVARHKHHGAPGAGGKASMVFWGGGWADLAEESDGTI